MIRLLQRLEVSGCRNLEYAACFLHSPSSFSIFTHQRARMRRILSDLHPGRLLESGTRMMPRMRPGHVEAETLELGPFHSPVLSEHARFCLLPPSLLGPSEGKKRRMGEKTLSCRFERMQFNRKNFLFSVQQEKSKRLSSII